MVSVKSTSPLSGAGRVPQSVPEEDSANLSQAGPRKLLLPLILQELVSATNRHVLRNFIMLTLAQWSIIRPESIVQTIPPLFPHQREACQTGIGGPIPRKIATD